MGTKAYEIEVKYRVGSVDALLRALEERGVWLSPACHQLDQAYAEAGWHYGMSKHGVAFARLRTQAGRHLFTLKKPQGNELICVEHETEVTDREQMHQALLHMGFQPTVQIIKSRRDARVGDLTICLDEVEHLGAFLEVEVLVDADESSLKIQDELDSFAQSLGVAIERVTDTYDSLLREALSPA